VKLLEAVLKAIGAVLMLALIALASGYVAMWIATDRDVAQVPRVIGIDAGRAVELLRAQGFQPRVTGREYSEQVPKDAVISQRPASGSWVKKDSEVRLIVSRGSDAVRLPSLAGLSLSEARRLLVEQGVLLGRIVQAHSAEYAKGQVIAQDPEAGASVRRGSPVALLISAGPLHAPAETLIPPRLSFPETRPNQGASGRGP
jgi:serine/threonine-protein kinase